VRCPACHHEILVRKDGRLRVHRKDGQPCDGSGAVVTVVAVLDGNGGQAA